MQKFGFSSKKVPCPTFGCEGIAFWETSLLSPNIHSQTKLNLFLPSPSDMSFPFAIFLLVLYGSNNTHQGGQCADGEWRRCGSHIGALSRRLRGRGCTSSGRAYGSRAGGSRAGGRRLGGAARRSRCRGDGDAGAGRGGASGRQSRGGTVDSAELGADALSDDQVRHRARLQQTWRRETGKDRLRRPTLTAHVAGGAPGSRDSGRDTRGSTGGLAGKVLGNSQTGRGEDENSLHGNDLGGGSVRMFERLIRTARTCWKVATSWPEGFKGQTRGRTRFI